MSVLVYAENAGGKFKKSSFEAISYGNEIARLLGVDLKVISIGEVADDELKKPGNYGAKKILNASSEKLKTFINQAYASVIAEAAKAEDAKVIVLSASFSGKGLASRIAIKLDAGLADGAVSLPDVTNGFTVRKTAFSGKAFADVSLTSDIKIITLIPNSYKVVENMQQAEVADFNPVVDDGDFKMTVKETVRASDKISLPD